MTPEEAATLANDFLGSNPNDRKKILDFLGSASPRNIQQFILCLDLVSGRQRYYEDARTALEIKLAENADLIADKLSNQTDRLLKFTVGLWVFTVILVFFALVQIIIMLMDYCSKNH